MNQGEIMLINNSSSVTFQVRVVANITDAGE